MLVFHVSFTGNSFEALVALQNVNAPNIPMLPLKATSTRNQPASYPKLESDDFIKYVHLCPYSSLHDEHIVESIMGSEDRKFDYLRCLFETPPPQEEEHVTCTKEVLPTLTRNPATNQSDTNTKKSKHLGLLSYDFGFYVSISSDISIQ